MSEWIVDPDQVLADIRTLSTERTALRSEMSRIEDDHGQMIPPKMWDQWENLDQAILECYEALDDWMSKGGRPPREWSKP